MAMRCPLCGKPLSQAKQRIQVMRRGYVERTHNVCVPCNVRVVLHVHDRSSLLKERIAKANDR